MLSKLFKHDMRQISKIMLPFMILVFGTTILGTAALKLAREISTTLNDSIIRSMFNTSLHAIFGCSVFALFAYAVLAIFLSVSRYYKNLFTDEGYLTFTLPVNSRTLIFSKLWSTLLWGLISAAVVISCVLIYVTFGGAPIGKAVNTEFFEALRNDVWPVLKQFFAELNVSYIFIVAETIALELVAVIYGILTLFLAITIGSILVKKHKILASIGFYYLINTAVSTISTVVMGVLMIGSAGIYQFNTEQTATTLIHVFLLSMLLIYAAIMVGEFLLTNYFLKKKLNLQ